jgi:RNA polymerase primary sigma factor
MPSDVISDRYKHRFVDHPYLHNRGAQAKLFPPGLPLPVLPPVVHLDEQAARIFVPTLTREQERHYFLAYNYARMAAMKAKDAAATAPWADRASHLCDFLVRHNVALVGHAYQLYRKRFTGLESDEAYSEGLLAILRAVDCFDVATGLKFSTYAMRAIFNAFSGVSTKSGKRTSRLPTYSMTNDAVDFDIPAKPEATESAERTAIVRKILDDNAADLNDNERYMISQRFCEGKPLILEQCGRALGVSKERARQIQTSALDKLRAVLEPGQLA